jgi:predicted dehydrogenase
MNSTAPIAVSVIGAGSWGKNIVRTLHSLGALDSVVEASDALREGIEQTYSDVPALSDFRDALSSQAPAVAIATPAHTHFEIAMAALEAGKDVFVEKPMTLTYGESLELVEAADKVDRILMTGHLLLYQPSVQWMKQAIRDGMIGRVLSVHQERLNLGRAIPVGNVLWSLGVHDIAVGLYLMDEDPSGVRFEGQKALGSANEDDTYLHLDFPSGAQLHLHNSWLWPETRRRTVVIGELGMFVYDEKDQSVTFHDKGINADLSNRDDGESVAFKGDGQPLTLELQHFLDCCSTRKAPISSGRSALQVIRVLEAASPQ